MKTLLGRMKRIMYALNILNSRKNIIKFFSHHICVRSITIDPALVAKRNYNIAAPRLGEAISNHQSRTLSGKEMTGGRKGFPRILGVRTVPGTIHRRLAERGGRLERKRRRRATIRTTIGRLCLGIKLIPACVAHQWLQTNRQSDFMLWPVSRWQPTRSPW